MYTIHKSNIIIAKTHLYSILYILNIISTSIIFVLVKMFLPYKFTSKTI